MAENNNTELDVLKLGNEFTTRRYLFNKVQIGRAIAVSDYIALHIIVETESVEEIYAGKTYLKDLSDKMRLTIRQTSRLIGSLKEKGLVCWSHDGNGSEGTYVTITTEGRELLKQQEAVMKDYFGKVIEKFGKENLVQLLNLMKQLETVMGSELEGMEMVDDESVE